MKTTSARSHRPSRIITIAAALAAAVGLFIAVPSVSLAATASHPVRQTSSVKPTIVLVHGAWADGSSFAPVTAALQLAGYRVLVAPNPLRTLGGDTKAVSDFIAQRTTGPVVLVGHSYGGMVITGAAAGNPNVKALVYVDAYAPDAGDSTQSLTNAKPGSLLNVPDPSTVYDVVLHSPTAPQAEWDSYIKADQYKAIFAGSLPTIETNLLAVSQSPTEFAAIGTPFSGTPAWKTIPSWFFIGTSDKLLPPAEQEFMATRAGGKVTKADSPHLAMLAKPLQVTQVVLNAAKSVK